eukprot:TRINITY_DN6954_c0_g1_i1.p1 TRINITY_DN6954_c0_g1~~TRINITY_DN6954_c0_g1_i1.p1  ORF type:complete len:432 (+),score=87.16 TRINITY_DN6954_c0_g1_i1:52-1296(+)
MEHPLSLKVMRLSRPRFSSKVMITDDSDDILSRTLMEEHLKDPSSCRDVPEAALGRLLILPQSFGMIYLGETFSCYISLHNDSTDPCFSISMKCDLQTMVHRITLYPQNKEPPLQDQLLPGDSIDRVLNHEVKDLGTHILVCEVFYTSPKTQEKSSFRKLFKFEVKKPLDVKTNFHNSDENEVFVEATIQNATTGCLYLEKVAFEPSTHFNVTSLNSIVGLNEDNSVFGPVNCLQTNDSRQYLFCLSPKPNFKLDQKLLRSVIAIGKIDVIWRTNLGERGRIKTSQLLRTPPVLNDIQFLIESCPSVVMLHQVFNISAKIFNNSERTLELEALCVDKNKSRLMWSGSTAQKLGLLQPDGCLEFTLSVVPLDTGLQVISGIRILDNLLKRTYEFDDSNQVFVTSDLGIFDAIISS